MIPTAEMLISTRGFTLFFRDLKDESISCYKRLKHGKT